MRLSLSEAATARLKGYWLAVRGIVAALLLVALVIASWWGGHRWAEGSQAIDQAARLRQDNAELAKSAKDIRDAAVDAVLAYDQAAQRLDAIATEREHDREDLRKFAASLRGDLDTLLDARPDLRDLDLGDDVLRHWNRSNQGPGAGTAQPAAIDHGQPAAGVPGAAAGNGRKVGHVAGQPRLGDRPVSRLRQPATAAGGCRGDMGSGCLGLVLPRHRAVGRGYRGLPA